MHAARHLIVATVISGVSLASWAQAITLTWDANGGTGGSWLVANNWNPDQVPTSDDDVHINSNTSALNPAFIAAGDVAVARLVRVGGLTGSTPGTGHLQISGSLTATNNHLRIGGDASNHFGTGVVEQLTGSSVTANTLTLGYNVDDSGTYLMKGGTLRLFAASTVGRAGNALFEQTGGTVTLANASNTAQNLRLGTTFASGSMAIYDMSGGSLSGNTLEITPHIDSSSTGGAAEFKLSGTASATFAGSVRVGADRTNGTTGKLTVTGGTFSAPTSTITIGAAAKGEYFQSGGTVTAGTLQVGGTLGTRPEQGEGIATLKQAANLEVENLLLGTTTNGGGIGKLVLEGSVTAGGSDLMVIGTGTTNGYRQEAGSTLSALIDAAGVRKIDVATRSVLFASGALLDVDFLSGTTPTAGTWTLMTYGSGQATDNGLTFAPSVDTNLWSFDVGDTALTVTYVPEPASLALVALGVGAVLVRKPRRR